MEYGTSATAANNWHVGSEGDGTFRWYNGNFGSGTERMRITSAGLVGIGRTDPTVRLDVVGTINASNVLINGAPISAGGSSGGYYQGNNGAVGSASGLGDIFRVHTNILNANVTIFSGNNALAAGPITVNVGRTLTIQSNARVAIV
jgi:hypothetical protein